jgi:hypothetical protein
MRLTLVLVLIHGLVPGLGEVAEAAVHYAIEGHLAHSAADRGGLGDLGDEHGCCTTVHHCGCCASQDLTAPVDAAPVASTSGQRTRSDPVLAVSLHEPAPPRRPSIAS